jgi:hypothetical protein
MEYQRTTGKCFISDATLAEQFGTSVRTIQRRMDDLSDKGILIRDTKSGGKGKERTMSVNIKKIEALIAAKCQNDTKPNDNLTLGDNNSKKPNDNLSKTKCQNDTYPNDNLSETKCQDGIIKYNIKDNIKEKEKENTGIDACASIPMNLPEEEIEIDGIKAKRMSTDEATEKFGWTSCMNRIPTAIPKVFWINKELVQIV